jgi:hypothetical protein
MTAAPGFKGTCLKLSLLRPSSGSAVVQSVPRSLRASGSEMPARISQGSRREAPPNGIACKAREGFQGEGYADIP